MVKLRVKHNFNRMSSEKETINNYEVVRCRKIKFCKYTNDVFKSKISDKDN